MSKPEYFRKIRKENRTRGYHIKRFWATMTAAEKKAFCKKRSNSLKKTLSKLNPEEQKKRLVHCHAGFKKRLSTKEGKAAFQDIARHARSFINNPVEKDLPRVNDYAGNITFSEYESL